nr:hypothetical protein [Tanacetum cinerariifolium]
MGNNHGINDAIKVTLIDVVRELLERPADRNVIKVKWLWRNKMDAEKTIIQNKSRLVSKMIYATEILEQAQMLNCNPCMTPIDTEKKLGLEGSPVTDPTLYRSLPGSLHMGDLYPLHVVASAFTLLTNYHSLWHQRLGHPGDASKVDSSLFIFLKGPDTAYLILYVDDIILTASSTTLLQRIISLLDTELVMTDLGPLKYFLDISATRTTSAIFLSQMKYATEILEQAQMLNCNPCMTPTDTEKKLGLEGSPVTDPTLYRSLPGSLQLQLFQFTTSQLIAYSDADWAGYTLSRSSAEVEYRGVANAVAETSWICNLLRELHTPTFHSDLGLL